MSHKITAYKNMKEINIKIKNISSRQWPLLLVELNLVAQNWKKFGPIMDIKARNFDKIIKWGKKKHGESEE
jgi:hypothetical protein